MNKKILDSMLWKATEKITVQLSRLVIEIVLARILIPSDFGIFTLLVTCIAISNIVIEGGLGNALIQHDDIDQVDINTVFWIMTGMALAIFVVLFLGAKYIATFYNVEEMTIYLKAISFVIFPATFNSVQISIATREMRFKDIFKANALAIIVSGIVAVILAISGLGIWALIIQYGLQILISSIVLSAHVKWLPQFMFSKEKGKQLYSFGWKIMASNLLNRGYGEIYNLVIGKVFNTVILGFYNRGKLIPSAIENGLTSVVISVMFPYFSRLQSNIEQIRKQMDKCIRMLVFVVAPVFAGLAAIANPLVIALLTDKWISIVPIFQILCVGLIFQPISHINTTVINSIGRSDIILKLEIIKRAIGLGLLFLSFRFGIIGVSIGLSLSYFLNLILNVRANMNLIKYSPKDLLKSVGPAVALSIAMFCIVYSITFVGITNVYLVLLVQIVVGIAVYILLSYFLNRKTLLAFLDIVMKYVGKTKH